MSPSQTCQQFFGEECECGYHEKHNWLLKVPEEVTARSKPIVEAPSDNVPILKVLHFTDIHFDQYYQPGSESDCDFPACCRSSVGYPAKSPKTAAGKWGDYRKCDSPIWLIENAFQHIAETHKVCLCIIFFIIKFFNTQILHFLGYCLHLLDRGRTCP